MDRRLGIAGVYSVRWRVIRNKARRGKIGRDQAGRTPSHTVRSQTSKLSGATEGFKQRSDMIKFHFR